ncbi:MAG: hypothetical protein A4E66_02595 [Syntrophus sp. PtaB.Bin001]|nr:MAG: hypothetical protein A4E66_02595 [Syntrophus sp. PtaB.Bin001]
MPVRQTTIIKNLKQNIKHIGVGLFNLVEKQDRIGPSANSLSQIPPLIVTHVTGRCSDQTSDGMLFHVF